MLKYIVLLFLFLNLNLVSAQDSVEKALIIETIQKLFDGMRSGDSMAVASVFTKSARLQTVFINKDGNPDLKSEELAPFLQAVANPRDKIWDERIWSFDIRIDGILATAWTEYTFFLGEQMSHCGVNAFQLFKSEDGWKIIQITDTRRREGCKTNPDEDEQAINRLMDTWHHAAAIADENIFFGSMTDDAVYLGTDASERWLRDELKEWSKQYFDRESAWAFTPRDRKVYFSTTGHTAWFEELLDTWMGVCRGSGVLEKTNDGWKIKHYNLAVTVPNEVINGFIQLVKNSHSGKE